MKRAQSITPVVVSKKGQKFLRVEIPLNVQPTRSLRGTSTVYATGRGAVKLGKEWATVTLHAYSAVPVG